MKVLHLPTGTGGMAWGLSRAERQLGLSSDTLIIEQNWIGYPADRVLCRRNLGGVGGKLMKLGILSREVFKIRGQYDVFHFNYGTTLLDIDGFGLTPLLDLPLYKGKGRIVVTYNGCDARQKYSTMARTPFSACHFPDCYNGICNSGAQEKRKKTKIEKFNRYADAIFAVNPDLLFFLPERAKFLPYAIANWDEIKSPPYYKPPSQRIRIVHAPTNRTAKGSDIIIEVLDKIKKRYGQVIEITLVENVPRKKALDMYAQADLIIDQILIGWYGGFSVETMKMGKPVMAYIRTEDLKNIPQEMASDCQEAIINVNPDTLFQELCSIIENPAILKRYHEAILDYVNRWHNPLYVAGITKSAYEF